jgi:hypothetical protein
MIRYREPDVVGGPITQLPQDLHFEESHDRVGQISKVDWPKAQAGLLMRLFHDWQRVRPRPRGRDSGRPTGLVVGRYLVRLRKGMGRGQATQGEGLVLLPAWLRHCGTASAGIEQVLTKKTGQEERAVEGMAKRRGGRLLLYPSKAADTCQDTLNHSAFRRTEPRQVTGGFTCTTFLRFGRGYGSSLLSRKLPNAAILPHLWQVA